MKTQSIVKGFLCLLTVVASQKGMAYQSNDRFYCRATCLAVDSSNNAVRSFGSLEGRSEIDKGEAFEVMKQKCTNLATQARLGFGFQLFVVRAMKVENKNYQSHVSGGVATKFRDFGYGYYGSASDSSYFSESVQDFGLASELEMADIKESCGVIESNPEGQPKYIGPDVPLS